MIDSLEELTAATLELNSRITSDASFDIKSGRKKLEEWFEDSLPPVAPGLLYRVEKGANTFCIKGVVSDNLRKDYKRLLAGNVELIGRLKIENPDDLNDLFFFQVDDFYYADQIRKDLFNRRFPTEEDVLCNLSDPGISWWLDYSNRHIAVYFNSHGINRQQKFTQLGPIGNMEKLCRLFNENMELVCRLFDVSEFVCTEKCLSIIVRKENDYFFNPLVQIFLNGEYSLVEDIFQLSHYSPTLHSYLYELSLKRKFWLIVESFIL